MAVFGLVFSRTAIAQPQGQPQTLGNPSEGVTIKLPSDPAAAEVRSDEIEKIKKDGDFPAGVLAVDSELYDDKFPAEVLVKILNEHCAYDWLMGAGAVHLDRTAGSPFVPATRPPVPLNSPEVRAIWSGDFDALASSPTLPEEVLDPRQAQAMELMMGAIMGEGKKVMKRHMDVDPQIMDIAEHQMRMPDRVKLAAQQYVIAAQNVYGTKHMNLSGWGANQELLDKAKAELPERVEGVFYHNGDMYFSEIGKSADPVNLDKTDDAVQMLEGLKTMLEGGAATPKSNTALAGREQVRDDIKRFVEHVHPYDMATYQFVKNFRRYAEQRPSLQAEYKAWKEQHTQKIKRVLPLEAYRYLTAGKPVPGGLISPALADRVFSRADIGTLIQRQITQALAKVGVEEKSLSARLLSGMSFYPEDLRLLFESFGDNDNQRRATWNQRYGPIASMPLLTLTVQFSDESRIAHRVAKLADIFSRPEGEMTSKQVKLGRAGVAYMLLDHARKLEAGLIDPSAGVSRVAAPVTLRRDTYNRQYSWEVPDTWTISQNPGQFDSYSYDLPGDEGLRLYAIRHDDRDGFYEPQIRWWINKIRSHGNLSKIDSLFAADNATDMTLRALRPADGFARVLIIQTPGAISGAVLPEVSGDDRPNGGPEPFTWTLIGSTEQTEPYLIHLEHLLESFTHKPRP